MSQETNNIDMDALYTSADKFISLANELAQEDASGTVGMALRYAAARYSAFESSTTSKNMAAEKDKIKETLLKDYDIMLEENLQIYIKHLEAEAKKNRDIVDGYTP